MRKLDEYRAKAKNLGKAGFLAQHGEPVFVPTDIITGSLRNTNPRDRNATIMHHDRSSMVNPLSSTRAMKIGSDTIRHNLRNGLVIGREAKCAVTIADYTISKQHARWKPGRFPRPATLEDMGSSNGTWINGTRLEKNKPSNISSGDTIRFGRMVLQYLSAKDFYERLTTGKI
jgi:hypothetical protein